MDYFKRMTAKNYTAWDLNCPDVVKPDNKLRRKMKQTARRKLKQETKDFQTIYQQELDKQMKKENPSLCYGIYVLDECIALMNNREMADCEFNNAVHNNPEAKIFMIDMTTGEVIKGNA